jgi:Rrf2 family protein
LGQLEEDHPEPVIYSTTTRYAVLMLAHMTDQQDGVPDSARDLSRRTDVPYPYLTKIVQVLVRRGILTSTRGRGGGLRFARPPERISLKEVVEALEGPEALRRCLFTVGECDTSTPCVFHPTWAPVREQILNFLSNTTIRDLAGLAGGKGA